MLRLAFWGDYLTTMRPYLLPISGLAGLAGMALADLTIGWRTAAGLAVFVLSYGFGQALTDCFQVDTDRLSAPHRPLVRGRISRRQVLAVSLAGLAASTVLLAVLNIWNLALAAAAVGGLLAYTPLKRRWWAGPLANAWVVALLPVMGWLVAPGNRLPMLPATQAVLAAALAGLLAYANFVLVGYLKDVQADRAAGYDTFAVRFGWRGTAVASDAWAAAALAAGALAVWVRAASPVGAKWPGWAILGLAALFTLFNQATVHRTSREDRAYLPTIGAARVFLLLQLAMVLTGRTALWPVGAATFAAFEFLLLTRPDRRQV